MREAIHTKAARRRALTMPPPPAPVPEPAVPKKSKAGLITGIVLGAACLLGGLVAAVSEFGGAPRTAPPRRPAEPAPAAAPDTPAAAEAPAVRPPTAARPPLVFAAATATIHGKTARLDKRNGAPFVCTWRDMDDTVSWPLEVRNPGTVAVEVTYACDQATAGSVFTVSVGAQHVTGKVYNTGSLLSFRKFSLGPLDIPSPGKFRIEVRATEKPGVFVMNLREVRLVPW